MFVVHFIGDSAGGQVFSAAVLKSPFCLYQIPCRSVPMYRTESSKTEAVSGHHQAELERSSGVCASAKEGMLAQRLDRLARL